MEYNEFRAQNKELTDQLIDAMEAEDMDWVSELKEKSNLYMRKFQ